MFVIISHTNTDFDSLASMWAAKKLFPRGEIIFTGSPEPNVKKFLDDYPEFSPLKERNIDLNEISNIVVVDTPQKKRLANFSYLLDKIQPELLVDHHGEEDIDIDGKRIVIKKTGAAITILLRMLIEKGISISGMEASLFALGLYEDTGFFSHSSVTEDDFRAMAFLMSNGCDISFVNQYLRTDMNKEQFQLLKDLSEHLYKRNIKGLPIYFSYGITDGYLADIAAVIQKLKQIHDISVIFVLVSMGKKSFLVARADENTVDCGRILKNWNGGGHSVSASASISAEISWEDVFQKIEKLIENSLNQELSAKDIMSSPVEWVCQDEKINEVWKKLHQLHHNSLIVLDNNKNVSGMISKTDLEKALHHKLGDSPVGDIMTTELINIRSDTSLRTISHFISSTHQRKYPVIEQGRLVGIVTANDILKTFLFPDKLRDESCYSYEKMIHQMKSYFQARTLEIIKELSQLAGKLGFKIYLVGGIVRDMLLGRKNNEDIDIVVEGDTRLLAENYQNSFGGRYIIYSRFHTATIITEDDIKIDLASARIEFYENPGALPTVSKSSLKYDLYRRDFSINTLAIDLNEPEFGRLIDFFSGKRDLKMRTLRVLHNLSFIEDPTRIIRAIRFAERFDFKIGENTKKLIESAIRNKMLKKISPQRTRDELVIILKEENPVKPIRRMVKMNIASQLPVQLKLDKNVFGYLENCHGIVDWYSVLFKETSVKLWLSYLYGILFYQTHQKRADFFQIYHFSDRTKDNVKSLVRNGDDILARLNEKYFPNSSIYFLLRELDEERIIFLLAYNKEERAQKRITHYLTGLRRIRLSISGKDLIQAGIQPGKIYKHIFDETLKARLDEKILKNEELHYALLIEKEAREGSFE